MSYHQLVIRLKSLMKLNEWGLNLSINQKLSILGGKKTITKPLERYNPIGVEEQSAVQEVMESEFYQTSLEVTERNF